MEICGTFNSSFLYFFLIGSTSVCSSFLYIKKKIYLCFPTIIVLSLCSSSRSSCKRIQCLHLESEVLFALSTAVFYFLPTSIRLVRPHHSTETALVKFGNRSHAVKSTYSSPLTSMKHSAPWSRSSFEAFTSMTSRRPPYLDLSLLGMFSLSILFLTVLSPSAWP